MAEIIIKFFQGVFGNGYLVGFIVSMIPLVELKGGILYMINAVHCNLFLSFLTGFCGSTLVAPVLLLIFLPLIGWMKKTKAFQGLANWVEGHFRKKSDRLEAQANAKSEGMAAEEKKKAIERAKYWGLFVFTAIPLPLTGCWTASAVAAILQLDYKKSLFAIATGNAVAGVAITLLGGLLGFVW